MSLIYHKRKKNRIDRRYAFLLFVSTFLAFFIVQKVIAQTCIPLYGGGQECVYNERFSLRKDVKREGEVDDKFKDKIGDLEPEDGVVFRITVGNTGDKEVEKLVVKDTLPNELKKVSGELEWEIEDFKPGEEVEFTFEAKVVSEEELGQNKEICVVNKAELFFEEKLENADTATVCILTPVITPISVPEVKELPQDGADSILNLFIILLLSSTGLVLRKVLVV